MFLAGFILGALVATLTLFAVVTRRAFGAAPRRDLAATVEARRE